MEGEEEFSHVKSYYGVITLLKTKKGLSLLDKFGAYRISKPLAWVMLFLMPVAGAAALYLLLNLLAIYLSPQGAAAVAYIKTISPLANLLVPGINPYVPIVYGWIALASAVFIHEASHGIIARSLGLPVKAAGILFLVVIPIGAFVEIDESHLKTARGRDTARVLAAGSGINIITAFAALALLILVVSTMVPATSGAAVFGVSQDTPQQHSPAYLAGIKPGDFITAINNSPVTDLTILRSGAFKPGQSINITIWRNGQTLTKDKVVLGNITVVNTQTNQIFVYPFLGVRQLPSQDLRGTVSTYTTQYSRSLLAYVAWIPTFPRFAGFVPYSDQMIGFYRSSLGVGLPILSNLLFWIWFININLAIFNSLPILFFDGGQAFEIAIRSISKGRISEDYAKRITLSVTLVLVTILVSVIVGPYLVGSLPT